MSMGAKHRPALKSVRQFASGAGGVAAIEFALVLPIMVLLLLGCFEVPRYILIYQKIARTSAAVADLVAQGDEPLTGNQVQDIFIAGQTMMQPYDVVADGKIYITSINNPNGSGVVLTWQRDNDGKLDEDSKYFNNEGSPPKISLPAGLTPLSNEEVLISEVFFDYKPILSTVIYKGSHLFVVSYSRPRNKNLMTPPPEPESEKDP